MIRYLVKDNFLEGDFFENLKSESMSAYNPEGKNSRSHFDIPENLMTSPSMIRFKEEISGSKDFWKSVCSQLNVDVDVESIFTDYQEQDSGAYEEKGNKILYSRVDLGYGLKGYGVVNGGRGLHIDNPNRVISCLLYLCDQKDFIGGEFEACKSDGSVLEKIELKNNRCILSVQDEFGWHRVNPLTDLLSNSPRVAIYFALSANYKYWDR